MAWLPGPFDLVKKSNMKICKQKKDGGALLPVLPYNFEASDSLSLQTLPPYHLIEPDGEAETDMTLMTSQGAVRKAQSDTKRSKNGAWYWQYFVEKTHHGEPHYFCDLGCGAG